MAFVDRNHGENRAVAVIAVAALEAGLFIAVAHGLTVAFIDPPVVVPPVTATNVPLPHTSPSDDPQGRAKEDPAQKDTSLVTAADSGLTTTQADEEVITFANAGGTGSLGGLTVLPSDPPPAFEPRSVRAINDRALWVGERDYPRSDLHQGHEGTTQFRLAIDAGGRVAGCTITGSSGYPGLDTAACSKVSQRARFEPARDATGAKVAGSYRGSIRWVIPD